MSKVVGEDSVGVSESNVVGVERSKPLHDFKFPQLKLRNQRYFGGIKASTDSAVVASTNSEKRFLVGRLENSTVTRKRKLDLEAEKRVPVKFKLRTEEGMFDMKTETDKLKGEDFRKEATEEKEKKEEEREPPQTEAAAVRPWNLRTRGAGLMAPTGEGSEKGLKIEANKPNNSILRTGNDVKLPRLKINFENKEKVKFSLPLSRKEIEEDFMQMVDLLPSRRLKKRPRTVQKLLDSLFPGLWLQEITADFYRVTKHRHNGKT